VLSRRRFVGGAAGALLVLQPGRGRAQEGEFLKAEDSPRQLFPGASGVTERSVDATPAFCAQVRANLDRPPTLWERSYRIFTARTGDRVLGFVVVVEEIGKHRPITFAVGIDPDGAVHDLAVLAYREAYGGEVKERRFLKQYGGRTAAAPLQPYRDIQNISGATLSVQATGRAVKKAIAVLKATGDVR
jgi:H+/Na+-translocating ferredoxin:NAD+ oxidoreductase subunit G